MSTASAPREINGFRRAAMALAHAQPAVLIVGILMGTAAAVAHSPVWTGCVRGAPPTSRSTATRPRRDTPPGCEFTTGVSRPSHYSRGSACYGSTSPGPRGSPITPSTSCGSSRAPPTSNTGHSSRGARDARTGTTAKTTTTRHPIPHPTRSPRKRFHEHRVEPAVHDSGQPENTRSWVTYLRPVRYYPKEP